MYSPHGVWTDGRRVVVADSGNHRVLIWHEFPEQRLRFPYAVVSDEQRLMVADTSNNQVLIWHGVPREGAGLDAGTVLAQPDLDADGENRWIAVTDDSLCWPSGLSLAEDTLAIADSGDNRVMFWSVD